MLRFSRHIFLIVGKFPAIFNKVWKTRDGQWIQSYQYQQTEKCVLNDASVCGDLRSS